MSVPPSVALIYLKALKEFPTFEGLDWFCGRLRENFKQGCEDWLGWSWYEEETQVVAG